MASGGSKRGHGACPKGHLCLWAEDNFGGQRVKIGGTGISNKIAQEMNNDAESAYNRRGKASHLYDRRNGRGQAYCVEPHQVLNSLGLTFGVHDFASSTKLKPRGTTCPT